jgi:hypothetical protein
MATGYEQILGMIQQKNQKEVSEVSSGLIYGNNSRNSETLVKPPGFQAGRLEVSGERGPSTSLIKENPEWVTEVFDLAVSGQLTEPKPVSVKPAYSDILGHGVWFCPDQETADKKRPDLAFTPGELIAIVPLLAENRELAATLISAKRISGGTIMDSSLLGSPPAEHHSPQEDSDDCQAPDADIPFDPAVPLDQNSPPDREKEDNVQAARELPAPGQHLVRIVKVLGYLHNFPEYTGHRARLEMEILEGPDAGKIVVDNVSMPHPEESKGMIHRRNRIACRLGLIEWGARGPVQVNWKEIEGKICYVDLAYKDLSGRKVLIVDNYELLASAGEV